MKFDWKNDTKKICIVVLCALGMALNIKTFVRTGGLYPGGATGLSILLQRVAESFWGLQIPYSVINILMNAFPVYIGFRFIGRKFTMYSCLMILLTGFFTDLIPARVITQDILLISVFGGIINGFVVSMCLSSGATTGGTDFIGIYLSQKKGVDSFSFVLAINAVILAASGLLFGWDKALYSMIFQYVSTQVLRAMYRIYQQDTLLIVTEYPQEVAHAIHDVSGHGATILEGEGTHDHHTRKIVYSVISSAQSRQVLDAVRKVDREAFINHMRTQAVIGHFRQPVRD